MIQSPRMGDFRRRMLAATMAREITAALVAAR